MESDAWDPISGMRIDGLLMKMRTSTEISQLWQIAHLKFHFGEKLAVNALLSHKDNIECGAEPADTVYLADKFVEESKKEPNSLRPGDLEAEIA